MVSPIPEHLHTVTPRLVVRDGPAAIDFYRRAFGAEEIGERFTGPDGELIHAEVRIGDSVVMVSEDAVEPAAGRVRDPFGHQWMLAQHIEDVSHEEMDRRASEQFG